MISENNIFKVNKFTNNTKKIELNSKSDLESISKSSKLNPNLINSNKIHILNKPIYFQIDDKTIDECLKDLKKKNQARKLYFSNSEIISMILCYWKKIIKTEKKNCIKKFKIM